MQRENLWMVQCMDREGDDVTALREQHMVGHMKHIEDIVDHIAMAGPLKDEAGEQIVGSFLAYRTDDLNQAKAGLPVIPTRRAVSGGPWSGRAWYSQQGRWSAA